MSTATPHLGLTRPAQTDFYNVNVFNENATRIDEAIQRMEEGVRDRGDEDFLPPTGAVQVGVDVQAAGATARVIRITGGLWAGTGTVIWVKFQHGITATNPTLGVAMGADHIELPAPIRIGNIAQASIGQFITPGRYYAFLFAGNAWQLLNPDGTSIPRIISTTSGDVATKTAALPGFVRRIGSIVWLTLAEHNWATHMNLNINDTGAAFVDIEASPLLEFIAGKAYAVYFDGSIWRPLVTIHTLGEKDGFGTVFTAAATASKTVSMENRNFRMRQDSIVWLRFQSGNTNANPVLSVGGRAGEFPIRGRNNTALPAGAIVANGIYGFIFMTSGSARWWQILNPTVAVNAFELFDTVYPVGSTYMSTNGVSPETLFGGTWEYLGSGKLPFEKKEDNDSTLQEKENNKDVAEDSVSKEDTYITCHMWRRTETEATHA